MLAIWRPRSSGPAGALYWPFYSRQHDLQQALAEVDESYKVCLQRGIVASKDCSIDRNAYASLQRNLIAPPDENPYQSFAGKKARDAIQFMSVLCLLPPMIVFALILLVLEVCLWFAHIRPQSARPSL